MLAESETGGSKDLTEGFFFECGRNQIALIKFILIDRHWGIASCSGFCIQERLRKTKDYLNQSLNVCLSVKSLSLFDFCFLERRILLEMERKQMFCRMISISQTCLYLIKFSVEVYLFQWTENWKYYFGKSIVRRIVQGRYWKPIKSYTLLCFIPTSTSMLLMIYSMY